MADAAKTTASANPYAQAGEHPRLDALLDVWANWMRRGGLEEFHVQAVGFWAHGSNDFDSMVERADDNDAIATNAAIGDLPMIEQCAVAHFHLAAVYRSNRESIEVVYMRARLGVSGGLVRRKVT